MADVNSKREEKRIDELDELTVEFGDDSLLPVSQDGMAYRLRGKKLKQYVVDSVDKTMVQQIANSAIGDAVGDAQHYSESASDSASSAENAKNDAEAASDAIQNFTVTAELVNTESDFGVVKTVDPNTGAVTLTFKNLKGRDGGAVIGQTLDDDGMYVNEINMVNAEWTGGSY